MLAGKLLDRADISARGVRSNLMNQYTLPEITGNITATYSLGPWGFQLQGRHISGDKLNRNWVEGVHVDDNYVASMNWWNSTVTYGGELDNGGRWNVGFNVLNLLDTHPPIVASGSGDQGVSNQYDVYGRRYNLSLNINF